MSLPPQTLRIKRQRDEQPVDTLYIEPSAKKQSLARTHAYFFRRVIHEQDASQVDAARARRGNQEASLVTNNGIPQVLATKPGDENKILKTGTEARVGLQHKQSLVNNAKANNGYYTRIQGTPGQAKQEQQTQNQRQPRRFHISARTSAKKNNRSEIPDSLNSGRTSSIGKRKQDRDEKGIVVVFEEERSVRRRRLGGDVDVNLASEQTRSSSHDLADAIEAGTTWESEDILTKNGLDNVQDRSVAAASGNDDLDVDMEDVQEEGDYIFDTFVRHVNPEHAPIPTNNVRASSTMDTYAPASMPVASIGYLVIDDAASADFWFDNDDDDADKKVDGDWDSEQDDENAENYYAADYPDEEEGEDEDAYRGKVGWRSQEFADEDREGEAWSGDEEDRYSRRGFEGHEHDGAERRFHAWRQSRRGDKGTMHDDDNADEDDDDDNEDDEFQVHTASPARPKYSIGKEEEEEVRASFQTMLSYMGRNSSK